MHACIHDSIRWSLLHVCVFHLHSVFIILLLDIRRRTRLMCYAWVKTQAIASQNSARKQIANIIRPATRQSQMCHTWIITQATVHVSQHSARYQMTVEQTCVQVMYDSPHSEHNNTHIHCNIPQLLIHHKNRLNWMGTCMLQVMCPVHVQLSKYKL